MMGAKKKSIVIVLVMSSVLLTGCIGYVWTGASVLYDRHTLYKKLNDFKLNAKVKRILYKDDKLKCEGCSIELAVFKGDILLVGRVPDEELREEAKARIESVQGYRRLFNQIAVGPATEDMLQDNWITTKIRSQIFADSDINPEDFKVVTSEKIVYLMGDVIPQQASRVIGFARECNGVKRVVKLFKYYNLSDRAQ